MHQGRGQWERTVVSPTQSPTLGMHGSPTPQSGAKQTEWVILALVEHVSSWFAFVGLPAACRRRQLDQRSACGFSHPLLVSAVYTPLVAVGQAAEEQVEQPFVQPSAVGTPSYSGLVPSYQAQACSRSMPPFACPLRWKGRGVRRPRHLSQCSDR